MAVLNAAEAKSGVGLKLVAQGLTSPVALVPLDASSGRLLIVDQIGAVSVLTKEGKLMDRPFLYLRGRLAKLNQGFDERGLLGLALHPRFAENRRLFVAYSAPLRKEGLASRYPPAAQPEDWMTESCSPDSWPCRGRFSSW